MAAHEARSLRVGISACLLGERVRHDGRHARSARLTETLGAHVEWVPVCPEVEVGLGVPRARLRLVRDDGADLRLVDEETGRDITAKMRVHAAWRARGLASLGLDGYVFKSRSPSCGPSRVPAHGADGQTDLAGRGVFAETLAEALPTLPIEDERRLARASVREHFVERMLAAARWRELTRRRVRIGDLVAFHTAHRYALLAQSPAHHEALGGVIAGAARRRIDDVVSAYGVLFAAAYAVPATRERHADALAQMTAFFARALSDDQRAELTMAIADYRRRATALEDPVGLIRGHVDRLGVAHLGAQVYLKRTSLALASGRGV